MAVSNMSRDLGSGSDVIAATVTTVTFLTQFKKLLNPTAKR